MAGSTVKCDKIINFILLQLVWAAFILGVTYGYVWVGLLVFLLMMGWQLRSNVRKDSDLVVIVASIVAGFVLASIWSSSDLILYKNHWPSAGIAPWWILALWVALGASFNHSLEWVQSSPYLAGLLFAIGGPLSYLGAERIGAVEINTPILTLSLMAVGWFLTGFLLTFVAKRFHQFQKWWVADA
ncbi:DUF2878 domain-containing protein [Kangiella spongicola]|uniref:DUF2878 domain-containing protein n=1 Tax=Kangiella spongicola TaxID=796379 RepID=A0A318D8H4_9GAMM|nr:DUF2878 domain-containing protein [Kangiella spongicola]PXF64088.1 DUF2878 domain-containing protein [Kangiella spongicola]